MMTTTFLAPETQLHAQPYPAEVDFFFLPRPSLTAADAPEDGRRVTRTERSDEAWVEALRSYGPTDLHADVVADLRDFLRRTLAKGFGQKLTPEDLEDLAQSPRTSSALSSGRADLRRGPRRSPSTARSPSCAAGATAR
jgi:hypothetical protein